MDAGNLPAEIYWGTGTPERGCLPRTDAVPVEYIIHTHNAQEQELLNLMGAFVDRYPEVGFAGLPHLLHPTSVLEFGIKGEAEEVRSGMEWLIGELNSRGYRWEIRRQ